MAPKLKEKKNLASKLATLQNATVEAKELGPTSAELEEARKLRREKLKKKKEAIARAQIITEVYGEQPFSSGIDEGLRLWIKLREQDRQRNSGGLVLPETKPTRTKYKYRNYYMERTHKEWREMIVESLIERERVMMENEEKLGRDIEAAEAEERKRLEDEAEAVRQEERAIKKAEQKALDRIQAKRESVIDGEIWDEAEFDLDWEVDYKKMEAAEEEKKKIEKYNNAAVSESEKEKEKEKNNISKNDTVASEIEEEERNNDKANVVEDTKASRDAYTRLPLLDKNEPRPLAFPPAMQLKDFSNYLEYGDRNEALMIAYRTQHWHNFDLLLRKFNPKGSAARQKQIINTHVFPKTKRTLLHLAVLEGDAERIDYLLCRGADPLQQDHRGDTVMHLCFDHDVFNHFHPIELAKKLLGEGRDVPMQLDRNPGLFLSSQSNDKWHPNHHPNQQAGIDPAKMGRLKARFKMKAIELANKPNNRGTTPLHRAILLGAFDHIELLLRNKATVLCFDKAEKMPIEYAKPDLEHEIKDMFNANVRFAGRLQHKQMYARIMSREFFKSIFDIAVPVCFTCRRKQPDCDALKKKDFRYWIYAHQLAAKKST